MILPAGGVDRRRFGERAGGMHPMIIDMDTTGNGPRVVGTILNCGEIDSGGMNTIDIDVALPSPGVHASDGIEVWEFLLNYDPAVVSGLPAADDAGCRSQEEHDRLTPEAHNCRHVDGECQQDECGGKQPLLDEDIER